MTEQDDEREYDQEYDYVIVGAGVAAASAAKAIRADDPDGTIAVFGADPDGPYYRPDLSKTLWLDPKAVPGAGWLLDPNETDVTLLTDTTVTSLDPGDHTLTTSTGATVAYSQLLLATGAAPNRLGSESPADAQAPGSERIIYYRTVETYRRLRRLAGPGSHVIVVGGGYIGGEIASALAQNDIHVTLVMPTELIQQAMFPEDLAAAVTKTFVDRGVDVVGSTRVDTIVPDAEGGTVTVTSVDGKTFTGDAVVLGLGASPNDSLAERAGITVDDGIVVDQRLETNTTDVYAAGDVANYYDSLLGRRRAEHVDQAENSGRIAGRNMVAARRATERHVYDYTPIFWSDLFDFGYEAVGDLDARLRTVENLKDDFTQGTVYYLDANDRVRGVLLWNVWDSTDKAKELIRRTEAEHLGDAELARAIEF